MLKKIIILSSGNGSNAEEIIRYFQNSSNVTVSYVISNKSSAAVFGRARSFNVPCSWFDKSFFKSSEIVSYLSDLKPDLIVLAGFLLKIPQKLVQVFPNKIINIHPALLPKYGGKGMYGSYVHEAVKKSGDTQTGITIHYVNENYDEGEIIFQTQVEIDSHDDPNSIAKKVHKLEHMYYPIVIDQILNK
tara:strand:- start:24444 stop:25010 length:567 start_codon:yes stop_codon:yes gene_type:complete